MIKFLITLFLTSYSFSLLAQEFDLTSFIKANQSKIADSAICRIALDSLNLELDQGMSWDYAASITSDDEFVNLYFFAGEGCGAYCNPIYQSVISIHNPELGTNKFIETEQLDFDLDSIVTLKKGKYYLVFGNHSGRPRGVESVWGKTVVLCSLVDGFKVKWRLESTTSNLVKLDSPLSEISFDPNNKTISYRYDWYDEFDEFKPYQVSGFWRFNGVTFEEQEKTTDYHKE